MDFCGLDQDGGSQFEVIFHNSALMKILNGKEDTDLNKLSQKAVFYNADLN